MGKANTPESKALLWKLQELLHSLDGKGSDMNIDDIVDEFLKTLAKAGVTEEQLKERIRQLRLDGHLKTPPEPDRERQI